MARPGIEILIAGPFPLPAPKRDPKAQVLIERLRALKTKGHPVPDGCTHVVVDASTKPSPMNYKRDTGSERLRVWKSTSQCWGPGVWKPADPGILPLSLLTADELAEFRSPTKRDLSRERLINWLRKITTDFSCTIPPGCTHVDLRIGPPSPGDFEKHTLFKSFFWADDWMGLAAGAVDMEDRLPLLLLSNDELAEFMPPKENPMKEALLQRLRALKEEECLIPDGSTHVYLQGNLCSSDFEKHQKNYFFYWCSEERWWESFKISYPENRVPLSLLTEAELAEFTSNSNTAIKPSVKQLTASDKEMITADGEPEDVPAEESQPAVAAFPATAYGIDSMFPCHLGSFHGG